MRGRRERGRRNRREREDPEGEAAHDGTDCSLGRVGPTARILLWSLADSKTSLDELRAHLPAAPDGTAWVADETTERFGLISLSGELPDLELVRELIGKDPEVGEQFDLAL